MNIVLRYSAKIAIQYLKKKKIRKSMDLRKICGTPGSKTRGRYWRRFGQWCSSRRVQEVLDSGNEEPADQEPRWNQEDADHCLSSAEQQSVICKCQHQNRVECDLQPPVHSVRSGQHTLLVDIKFRRKQQSDQSTPGVNMCYNNSATRQSSTQRLNPKSW